jgi:hypothetical protein
MKHDMRTFENKVGVKLKKKIRRAKVQRNFLKVLKIKFGIVREINPI